MPQKYPPKKIKRVTTITESGKVVSKHEETRTDHRCQYCGKTQSDLYKTTSRSLYRCESCGIHVCYGCSKHDETIRSYQGKDGMPSLLLYINPNKMPWYSGEVRQSGSEVHLCPKCHEKHQDSIKLLKDLVKAHEDIITVTTKETKRIAKILFPKGYR